MHFSTLCQYAWMHEAIYTLCHDALLVIIIYAIIISLVLLADKFNCYTHRGILAQYTLTQHRHIQQDKLFIAVPQPISVLVRNHPANPIGTDVTLTCVVELSQAVDIPVTVTTYLFGPERFSVNNSITVEPVTGHTTTTMISSFGIDNSGSYTCAAEASTTTS